MISIDEFKTISDEIADSLPRELFTGLNGGILLLEQEKLHPQSRPLQPLYIMGEYHREQVLGCYIVLYYGSFAAVYGSAGESELREQIRGTILHEFRHHIEGRGGTRELEIDDEEKLGRYLGR